VSHRILIPCPCCRASNDTGPACRRCKADLSLLFAVAEQRTNLVAEAQSFAAEGKFADALRSLEDADALRGGDDVRQLRAAVLLVSGDFATAWAAYTELTNQRR
jgi:hypothetical protein